MSILMILGILILIIVGLDVLITALTVGGGGSLTKYLSYGTWLIALRVHQRQTNHQFLFVIGWLILVLTALVWFILVWVGWTLIFTASDINLVNASTREAANLWEKVYFVGYTLSTLGLGDFQPQGPGWQWVTAIASASGFALITLTITYLLPVISAVTQRRELAVYISALGGTPDEILSRAWSGKTFGKLDQHLIALTPKLILQGEQHLAYPILHYFHSPERSRALVLSVSALDEALTLLKYGVVTSAQPDAAALEPTRRAIASFLKTLNSSYVEPASKAPPILSLNLLRQCGIPTVEDEEFLRNMQHLSRRRKLLRSIVEQDGWTWNCVASAQTTHRAQHLDDDLSQA